ncbi:MAG: carboxylating nicotinate-nucleotide diphosphorylase [Bacteroidetes bacterium]|nr:MAG: carboxylating nicotinate-nucleotide diphosphorylase [Bacteroidota bacterium]
MLPDYITKEKLNDFINSAIYEDCGNGDHTSLASIPKNTIGKAQLILKDNGIVAGIELSKYIFKFVDRELDVDYRIADGSRFLYGEIGLVVKGSTHSILKAERLVLNCMQRMSGIATETFEYKSLISHTNAKLLDTRKTTPNFRMLEKWAVKIGGGENHRFGLFDMILIKDNHVDYSGGIENAVLNTLAYLKKEQKDLKIIVEVRNLNELEQLLKLNYIYRVLLDNMPNEMLKDAVKMVNKKFFTEASGGVSKETIVGIAETGVDFISVGKLTHSYKSLDISLKAF